MSVLNPALYETLQSHFGRIVIANRGMSPTYAPRTTAQGVVRLEPKHGEAYRVNCPYCGDRGNRLYFNHLWGVALPDNPYPTRYLIRCFHTDDTCISDRIITELEYKLLWSLSSFSPITARSVVYTGEIDPAPAETEMPGPVVPLTQLRNEHSAIHYLRGRSFDPTWLSKTFGIGYCVEGIGRYLRMSGRIFIPVWQNGRLAGWQGRLVGETDRAAPRYYNYKFMHKSECLYNMDVARHYQVVVLVEGVTKVWRVGPNAVASFGAMPSVTQVTMLADMLGQDGVLVFMPDGDTWYPDKNGNIKVQRSMELLRQYIPADRIVPIQLPQGGDPGDMDVTILHPMLAYHLRQANIPYDLFAQRTAPPTPMASRGGASLRYVPASV